MCITSGMVGILRRWRPQIWPCSTLLHAASCCVRKSSSPPDFPFEEWEIWAHCWGHTRMPILSDLLKASTATWRVGLYRLHLPNLPTASYIWMMWANHNCTTWANHNLMTTIGLDSFLHTVLVTVLLSALSKAVLSRSKHILSPMCAVRQEKRYKLYLSPFLKTNKQEKKVFAPKNLFQLARFPIRCSEFVMQAMRQRGELTWYQRCTGFM